MKPVARVLVIDDETLWHQTYRQILEPEGYELDFAADRAIALARLGSERFDVVLLDRKLQAGATSPDTGLDLLEEIVRRAPLARTIVVTGFPDAAGVVRSFEQGAWDHLEKNKYLPELLRIKLRQALEPARERRLASLGNGQRTAALEKLWRDARDASDSNDKGRLLEQLLLLLFRSIPGWENARPNPRTVDEEIDVVIANESSDPLWHQEGSYILVEAKNWSSRAGPVEFDRFRSKMERRYARCRLGFFVSVNGFTAGFEGHLLAERKGGLLVVPLTGTDLDALVSAKDRDRLLKEHHQHAAAGA